MARRKNTNTKARVAEDTIPSDTITLAWGDKRGKQSHPGAAFSVYMGERFMHQTFDHLNPAKHFIELMIDGNDFTWGVWPRDVLGKDIPGINSEPMLVVSNGIRIKGTGLEQAVEYEYQGDEANYVFPEPYQRMFEFFPRRGLIDERAPAPKPEPQWDPKTHTMIEPTKPERTPKAPKPVKAKVDKSGLVLVSQIAADNKWDPKHVRAALRKAKIEKPAVGWAFPPAEVARITKAIKDNIK